MERPSQAVSQGQATECSRPACRKSLQKWLFVGRDAYADALTEGGRYLFGILPGRSVSCPCTSFM